jgi:hypothetical protein
MATRRRCTECRSPFTPSPRAQQTQRVCGPACRAARDRKLARARRCADIAGARAEERIRQQASRAHRAAVLASEAPPAAPAGGCHAPASAPKSSELPEDLTRFVDRAIEASRASLLHDLRRKWPRPRAVVAMPRAVSRASFGVQMCDPTGESAALPARCHA